MGTMGATQPTHAHIMQMETLSSPRRDLPRSVISLPITRSGKTRGGVGAKSGTRRNYPNLGGLLYSRIM